MMSTRWKVALGSFVAVTLLFFSFGLGYFTAVLSPGGGDELDRVVGAWDTITGRYVEIQMFPLSFKEFLDFQELGRELSLQEKFDSYLKYGSMPAVSSLPLDGQVITNFLQGIYNTVIMKDVIQRNVVKDALLLESVLRYLMQNIGTIFSTKKIGENCTSGSRRTSQEVVESYLNMFEQDTTP